ncbi:MAG: hypothetical protein ACREAB_19330 [Blastocatellia bacterium]
MSAADAKFNEEISPSICQAREWRVTTKPGRLYVHIFTWPKEFTLEGVKGKVTKASLLASPKHKELKFSHIAGKLVVQLPDKAPGELASVIRLDVRGEN